MGGGIGREAVFGALEGAGAVLGGRRYWEGRLYNLYSTYTISKLSYLVFSKSAPLAHIMSPCIASPEEKY